MQTLYFLVSSFLILWNLDLTNSYTFSGNIIKDLESTATTDFNNEANAWSATWLVNSGVKTYNCNGKILLGGFNILGGTKDQYFQRTYSGLPAHNLIQFTMMFYPIDSWDGDYYDDHFDVSFDSTVINAWRLSIFSGYGIALCGESWNDFPPIKVKIEVPHTSSSVTLRVINQLDQYSNDESMGFREVTMTFVTVTSPKLSFCGTALNTPLPYNICPCETTHQFMSPANSGTCYECDAICKTCATYSYNCLSCYDGTYLSGGSCPSCHSDCATCNGGSSTSCLTCPTGSYKINNNACVTTCNSPLVSSTTGAWTCSTPCPGSYAYWDGSCSSSCAFPLQLQTYNTFSTCTYPCTTSQYLYWNGSCIATCPYPLTDRTTNNRKFCDYPCTTSQYLYWNKTCANSCSAPLVTKIEASRNYCLYPCTGSDILYWNGSCIASCSAPLVKRTEAGKDYCDYPCLLTQYLYWNGSCLNSCSSPHSTRVEASRNYCDYPCTGTNILYWNASCIGSCSAPLVKRTEAGKDYCDYPCQLSQALYWNGSCLNSCSSPHSTRVEASRNYCDYPCIGTNILYWNASCIGLCSAPLVKRTEAGKDYCDYPCQLNQYLYWNGSCLSSCNSPHSTRVEASRNYCDYPCTGTNILYWNASCIGSCSAPLVKRTEAGKDYCDYPCQLSQYLYWNGSCLGSCTSPHSTRVEALRNYCDYPCTGSDYLYWNGTCAACNSPLRQRLEAGKNYCDYPCQLSQYLYWNGSCFGSCPSPLSYRPEASRNYCDYPCTGSDYLYWNGTCTACNSPLKQRVEAEKLYCDYPCLLSQYLFWNGSCLGSCPSPLSYRPEASRNYCDYPCKNVEYLYWNTSCIGYCKVPFSLRIEANQNYCDYPCKAGEKLYWDGTCSTTCSSPLTPKTEGNPIIKDFCTFGCKTNEFLYWDGSCSKTCSFPLITKIANSRMFCQYPCATNEYLYWNGSCKASCTTPFSSVTNFSRQFCNYPCKTSEYLYWNGSCISSCDSPLVQKSQGKDKFCDYPCTNTSDFLYSDGSCSSNCPSPLTPKSEGNPMTRKFCTQACNTGDYLYWDGSCSNKCSFPLVQTKQRETKFCQYPCSSSEYLHWNGSCISSCELPLSSRKNLNKSFCEFPCKASEYLYWNGSCSSECEAPLSNKVENGFKFCDFGCAPTEYLHWNGVCSSECPARLTKKIEGSLMTRKFCVIGCEKNEYLGWDGSHLSNCSSPYIKNGPFCDLPCDNSTEYYFVESQTCTKECNSPYVIDTQEPYRRCLTSKPVESTATLFSMFLDAPLQSGTLTVVKVVKAMQYMRFLDIKLPPRLERLGTSRGRGITSVGSSARILNQMQSNLIKETLPSVFAKHNFDSGFLGNFWDNMIYLLAAFTAGVICYLLEILCRKMQSEFMEAVFMRLRVIFKWNVFLMMLATYIDDVILYSSLEFRTLQLSSDASTSQHLSLILCLLFIILTIVLMIGTYSLVSKLQKSKISVLPHNKIKETTDNFDSQWVSFQVLYRGLKDNNSLSQFFFLIYTIRIGLPMLITVCATGVPLLVIGSQIVVNFSVLIFLVKMKPFKKRINHIQIVLYELIVFMMNVCMLVLVIFHVAQIENEDVSVVLGDIIIVGNDCLNILIFPFLIIKLKLEVDVIRRLQKLPAKGKNRRAPWLQLLALAFQQSNMGYEEIIEEEEEKSPITHTYTAQSSKEIKEKEEVNSIKTRIKQRIKQAKNRIVPANNEDEEKIGTTVENTDKLLLSDLIQNKKVTPSNMDLTNGQDITSNTQEDLIGKAGNRIRKNIRKRQEDVDSSPNHHESEPSSPDKLTIPSLVSSPPYNSTLKDISVPSLDESPTFKRDIRRLLKARSMLRTPNTESDAN